MRIGTCRAEISVADGMPDLLTELVCAMTDVTAERIAIFGASPLAAGPARC